MEKMTRVVAVRAFFQKDATRPVENKEMMEFWKACNADERKAFAESAAQHLGVELIQEAGA